MGNGTSIGRVRGLGSAHEGVHHWLLQRFTAIGNLVLVLWLAGSILLLPDLTHATVSSYLAAPVPATAMALLIVSTFWHARLGLQVMIEDYVHTPGNKFAAIAALNLAAVAGAGFGLFCVARLALGGTA
ncbi:succinate dehydrogenase, hydrophobic membrane anchor protein [Pelagerythrobacter marinus]|uniref:Succinate dehydrogenase hydrophobic membrane anchor subunit n=1 Tax=Pelagerythrobacter marinus TaxID=538382 RepID=A0ABW9URT8_9SPHN|nr:succinate dehydrogenase, hydrophobic membrane anchor protein [Pelagerythrobacter marinus]MEC9067085.1 succinate dehydrogenase, hydrophobic membrane anchor protein [Pseudomonadota bacterium]MXO67584.1 succinate dehydrogenase, hydrophobic membrane anchor protein [Pelagerythrobacter marinus]USA38385.1 succinate dehydrogenase, hydrophobic membrane anchor protein [Pelagerythrobacter marinus]WPZ07649.1 succinate dehydrogenase, hydrophobic membrane anchor protein [Pelagerythrobacter marinus]